MPKKEAMVEYQKAYKAAHREEIKAYNRAYYAAHKEEIKKYQKSHYAKNKEEIKCRNKEYHASNTSKNGRCDRLIQYRKEIGLTQSDLAKLVGVSQAAISLYESGKLPCDVDALIGRMNAHEKKPPLMLAHRRRHAGNPETKTNHVQYSTDKESCQI
jgi:DNA-binding XRE family transcriptional regulator